MLKSIVMCCGTALFRYRDLVECPLITLKSFNSSHTVSSYRLAKLSDGFFRTKTWMGRKHTELTPSLSQQNTFVDGE